MVLKIVKQPNDKYALYSTVEDTFTDLNLTEEEVIHKYRCIHEQEWEDKRKRIKNIMTKLNDGGYPYKQFTMSFEDCLEIIEENHSEKDRMKFEEEVE